MTRPLCIYHGHCADGFASAWVVRKAFLGQIDFHAGCYGDDPPEVLGRDVFLVDFSYPRPVLEVMVAVADSVTILDHHVTAAEDLDSLPGAITRFDLDHSGGMITWQYFFGSQTPPALLAHIEDRDLWRFRIDGTREIMAGLFSYPYDFDLYDYWMADSTNLDGLVNGGVAILRKTRRDLDELLPKMTRMMLIGGCLVPAVNLPPTMASEAAGELATGHPFAACYWDGPLGRTFSLRSDSTGLDVSLIARRYGGGGHWHAAGFRVDHGVLM